MQKTTVFAIAGLLSGVLVGWGCSSSPPSGSTSGPSGASSSSSSGGGSSSGGSSGGSSSGGSSSGGSSSGGSSSGSTSSSSSGGTDAGNDPDLACYSMTSASCETCCETHHPTGSTQYNDAWSACLCVPAKCQTACAQSDCNDADDAGTSTTGDPCDLCIQQYLPDNGGGACEAPIKAACTSADCVAYSNCSDNCP